VVLQNKVGPPADKSAHRPNHDEETSPHFFQVDSFQLTPFSDDFEVNMYNGRIYYVLWTFSNPYFKIFQNMLVYEGIQDFRYGGELFKICQNYSKISKISKILSQNISSHALELSRGCWVKNQIDRGFYCKLCLAYKYTSSLSQLSTLIRIHFFQI
jgi:hypothetical protein